MEFPNEISDSAIDFSLPATDAQVDNFITTNKPSVFKVPRTLLYISRQVTDICLIYCSFLLTYYFRYLLFNPDRELSQLAPVSFGQYCLLGISFSFVLFFLLKIKRYYAFPRVSTKTDEILLIGNATLTAAAVVTMVTLFVQPNFLISRLLFILLVPVTWTVLGLSRLIVWNIQRVLWSKGIGVRKLIVIGTTATGVRLIQTTAQNAQFGYKLLGFVDDSMRFSDWHIPARYGNTFKRTNIEVPYLGTTSKLGELIELHKVDEVMIALPVQEHQVVDKLICLCREKQTAFTLVPDLYNIQPGGIRVRHINGIPLFGTEHTVLRDLHFLLKRAIDIFGSLTLILIALLPMLAVAIAVKLDSKGSVIYRQIRVGKNGKTFTLLKFRSMYADADARLADLLQHNETNGATFKMKKDVRVTKVGRFIRRMSLDELPQLFNILWGQMSLVGPRPALEREVLLYKPWQLRRLEVVPGLTGLWQVNGRSSITFEEMVKLDIYYVDYFSLLLDFQILVKTVKTVLKAEGAY